VHHRPIPPVRIKTPSPSLEPSPPLICSLLSPHSPARPLHHAAEASPSPVSPSPRVDHRRGRRSPSTILFPLCSLSACLYHHRDGQISCALARLQGKLRRTTPCRRRLDTGGAREQTLDPACKLCDRHCLPRPRLGRFRPSPDLDTLGKHAFRKTLASVGPSRAHAAARDDDDGRPSIVA
jgi:hypothetical protein